MPSSSTPPARRRRAESLESEDDEAGSDLSHTSKRQRPSPPADGAVLPRTYLARPDSNGTAADGPRRSRATREHQPGSIVRVRLVNFVTYKSAEILPGPSLNMVIGPNGTGKSTLVCAICLGLGWDPKYLGRQKEAHEFIKHGEAEAEIEIELRRKPTERRNTTVKCTIKRDGNKTTFAVNGRAATKKAAQDAARAYAIQIDNLCQFLPQDKVVEFAAMSPVDLLRSTQQAVAPAEMVARHDELIALRQSEKALEQNAASNKEHLAALESRQKMQESDVERVREREQVQKLVGNWEKAYRVVQLRVTRRDLKAERKRQKQCELDLAKLEQELGPALAAVKSKEGYVSRIKAVRGERAKAVEAAERHHGAQNQALEKLGGDLDDLDARLEAQRKARKDARVEKARLEQVLQGLHRERREQPPAFDVASLNETIRAKERRALALRQDELPERRRDMEELRGQAKAVQARTKEKDEEIKGLDSQAGKQASKLQRLSSDSYQAWKYIQAHQDQFEKPVFGPPMISCSVKDPRYIPLLEALFSRNDFMTFTAQTNRDFDRLHKIIHEDLKLGEVNIRTTLVDLDRFRGMQPSDDERRRWGFDGWALDFVEGPEPVLAMLCELLRLHVTGVALGDTSEAQFDALHASGVGAWVTSKHLYKIVRRREYGPGATSTSVQNVKPPQVWTDQPADLESRRSLNREKQQLMEEFDEIKEKGHDLGARIKAINEEIEELQGEIVGLKQDKDGKQKAQSAFRALPTKIESVESKIRAQDARLAQLTEQAPGVMDESEDIRFAKCDAALNIYHALGGIAQARTALEEADVVLIEAGSDHETLIARNQSVHTRLQDSKAEVAEAVTAVAALEVRFREAYLQAEQLQESYSAEDRGFVEDHMHMAPDEVQREMDAERARLALMHEGAGGRVVAEFEARQARIAALRARAGEHEAALAEVSGRVAAVRARWEPRLDALAARISAAFAANMARIGCAGEVGVAKEADFEAWSVRIRVKFREAEPLTQLDAHRQSGGERAVATIFYLMSLQALTRSPFRVVDEINQGMDPRNERLVHGRMVEIATGGGGGGDSDGDGDGDQRPEGAGSQYFLITPKLLHGLRYEEGMRVLCIASGEHLASQGAADFAKAIAVRRRMAVAAVPG